MYVAGMNNVDRHVTCHTSVNRDWEDCRQARREAEARAAAEGVVQALRRRAGRPRCAVVEDEPLPQANPDYEQMDVEHQTEDDVEAVEEDAHQQ